MVTKITMCFPGPALQEKFSWPISRRVRFPSTGVIGTVVGCSLVKLVYTSADNPLDCRDLGVWVVSSWLVRWDLGGTCLFPVSGSPIVSEYQTMWDGEKPRYGCCVASHEESAGVPGFAPWGGVPVLLELVPAPG